MYKLIVNYMILFAYTYKYILKPPFLTMYAIHGYIHPTFNNKEEHKVISERILSNL